MSDTINVGISVIAGNCADILPTFFRWATSNFDEINVVCQPENYDETLEVCEQWANKHTDVIRLQIHEFDNFSNQKQRALDMCTKQWCVQLDADEILAEFPYKHIPKLMDRTNKKVGILPRYNLQRDSRHFAANTYPDYQKRIIKMNAGISMDGKVVDETLKVDESDCIALDGIPIIHFGHIRPEHALKQKGRDRKKFAAQDKCDGQQLLEVGSDWFIVRNKSWDEQAQPLNAEYITWIERFYE